MQEIWVFSVHLISRSTYIYATVSQVIVTECLYYIIL